MANVAEDAPQQGTRNVSTFCRICEPLCPLLAELDADGSIRSLAPDREHPVSKGFACRKGLSYLQVHDDPDRVNTPLRRTSANGVVPASFAAVSWDEAFADIGRRLRQIRDRYGPNAISVYYGNPVSLNSNAFPLAASLGRQLGSHRNFSAATQDTANKPAAVKAIFGASMMFPIPDFLHTKYLLAFGCNPMVSHWTYTSVHRPASILQGILDRGGKVRFVNSRQILSAGEGVGDITLIKPDTDAYLMAAILNHIEALGRFDVERLKRYGRNLDGLRAFIGPYTPERVAGVTGVDASTIRRIAEDYSAADCAAVYMGTGVNQGRQGTLAYWLLMMLSFVTGNLGRLGGDYYGGGVYPNARPAGPATGETVEVGGGKLNEIAGGLPGFALAELIDQPQDPVRALIVLSGNPLLSLPGEPRMREAFPKLDLMVHVDLYRNATGEYADYILPAADWLERGECNLSASGMQPEPFVQFADAVVAPRYDRRDDWWIISRLQQELGLPSALDGDAPDMLARARKILARQGLTVEQLRQLPGQSAILPQARREAILEELVFHADGKIDCCPAAFAPAIGRCSEIFAELEREPAGRLKLISLRTGYMHNSSLANMPALKRGRHASNPLHMHPDDAASRGLVDGDVAEIRSEFGRVRSPVRIDRSLQPGVVAMSHGYGHALAKGLTRASADPGVNVNALMPVGPQSHDPLSNMAHFNGLAVEVAPT